MLSGLGVEFQRLSRRRQNRLPERLITATCSTVEHIGVRPYTIAHSQHGTDPAKLCSRSFGNLNALTALI